MNRFGGKKAKISAFQKYFVVLLEGCVKNNNKSFVHYFLKIANCTFAFQHC